MSYINNLPIEETDLYGQIEKLFEQVLPEFKKVVSYSNALKLHSEDNNDRTSPKTATTENVSFKNVDLQVITKIVRISLKNGDSLNGAWHVEGMSHENIIATATCTINQSENMDNNLYFKRAYTASEAWHMVETTPQDQPYKLSEILHDTLVPLGRVHIESGTIVVFPNSHIHRIDMKSESKEEQTRTILVFWLINPDVRIVSTKDIPQQNYDLEKAREHRLELMKERTYHKQTFNQRELNLCEH